MALCPPTISPLYPQPPVQLLSLRKLPVLSHSFALFQKSENHLSCFQQLAHSLQKMPGCTLLRIPLFPVSTFHFLTSLE